MNDQYIWLNSAGVSTPHNFILDRVRSALTRYGELSYLNQEYGYDTVKNSIKKSLSKLLQSKPHEVSLIHNTAEGMNFIAHGIDLKRNDEILLLEKEYPSNVYPWLSLYKKGVRVKFIPISSEASDFLNRIEDSISKNTKVISVSAVHWLTGIALPLKKIGQICKRKNIIFVVDSAQGLGHVRLHPKKCHISFLCGSAWKWLLGPLGLGYLYISDESIETISPVFWGGDSIVADEEPLNYLRAVKGMGAPEQKWKRGADRFCYSSASYLDWAYFDSALKFLDSIGFERVRSRIHSLAHLLKKKLSEARPELLLEENKTDTGIVVARSPELTALQLQKKLKEKKIITALRDHSVRFSTHIMNTESQMERCAAALM